VQQKVHTDRALLLVTDFNTNPTQDDWSPDAFRRVRHKFPTELDNFPGCSDIEQKSREIFLNDLSLGDIWSEAKAGSKGHMTQFSEQQLKPSRGQRIDHGLLSLPYLRDAIEEKRITIDNDVSMAAEPGGSDHGSLLIVYQQPTSITPLRTIDTAAAHLFNMMWPEKSMKGVALLPSSGCVPRIRASIESKRTQLLIDTGAEWSVWNPAPGRRFETDPITRVIGSEKVFNLATPLDLRGAMGGASSISQYALLDTTIGSTTHSVPFLILDQHSPTLPPAVLGLHAQTFLFGGTSFTQKESNIFVSFGGEPEKQHPCVRAKTPTTVQEPSA
jgi:hypothetical protein